jgi:hypothetical protein
MKKSKNIEEKLLNKIFDNFKESANGNGLASYNLNIEGDEVSLLAAIENLIKTNTISILASDHDINPHIIRLGFVSTEEQIKYLKDNGFDKPFCLYPSQNYLSEKIKPDLIPKYPFRYMMQIGVPQLKACYFEWGILYKYFSDPRYKFQFSDYIGKIDSSEFISDDCRINLKRFGIGRDGIGNRVVIAFPIDLARMSSACQIEWQSMLVQNQEECKSLASYVKNLLEGCWDFPQTIYNSIVQEMSNINSLAIKIWKHNFFREVFDKNKPVDFDMIYIPTYKAYMDYVSLLEKIVVSNIDDKFFDAIGWKRIDDKGTGVKGTLSCLTELVEKVQPSIVDDILSPLKEVRKLRQKPAHKIENNYYDIAYLDKQHDLSTKVYESLLLLRRLMQTHPEGKNSILEYNRTDNYIVP